MFGDCCVFLSCHATAVSVAGSITTATLASASDNPTLGNK